MIRHRLFLIASAVTLLLCAAIAYIALVPDPLYRDPAPVRVLKRNRKAIMQYLASIHDGRFPLRSDGRGYFLPNFIDDVNSVDSDDGCIVITFQFITTDAVPQLVYSPTGFEGLPALYKHTDIAAASTKRSPEGLTYFHREQVDDKWFYCEWDN